MKAAIKHYLSLWYVPATLLLFAAIAYVISQIGFGNESLRLDESQSIWQTSHSLGETLFIVAQDVHMPLYHIIFHYWTVMFGDDVSVIRFLSFIFFVVCLPFVYLLGRTILSRPWALLVTGLFVLSPFVNWYGNEARMYTLLALMSIISQWLFIRIMRGQRNTWPWYVVIAVIGAYSHYFFFFNLMAQALFYFFSIKQFPKGSLKKFILTAITVLIAISPWMVYFIMQGAASNTKPMIAPPSPIDFFNVYSQFLFGFQGQGLNTILISFWPLLVVVALIIVKRSFKPDLAVRYIVVAAFLPVLLAFVLSFIVSPFFLSRYMIAAVAPLYIIIAWILSRFSKKIGIISSIIVVALMSLLLWQQITGAETTVRENYKQVAIDITEKATPRDTIIMSSPFTVYPFEYYYKGPNQIHTLPLWDRQNPGPVSGFDSLTMEDQVNSIKEGHDYVYLILSYDQGYEDEVRTYFRNNFELVNQKQYSPKLEMLVYKVGYADPVYFTR